jgi:gamma-glutamyltranspeptidase/glutathione hydrolase
MSELPFDLLNYPYDSRRTTTVANKGMVATAQPLASQAGLDILKKGGNAVDAAIATAAALAVVEPTSNGIGGDAFALVWMKDELHGLNASGPAPKNISIDAVKAQGHREMPRYGWTPVTVPGVPAAWGELSEKFGKLPLTDVLQPAINYAENGYPISPVVAYYWKVAYKKYKKTLTGKEFTHWFETFAPKGRAPKIGEVWSSKNHASTLRSIAESKGRAFYEGELADKIAAFSKAYDGFLTKDDLIDFEPEWVDPISINYQGYKVWELPPNGQGLITLNALNILNNFDADKHISVESYHKEIEALKLAFSDGQKYITDPYFMKEKPTDFLTKAYGKKRSELIEYEAKTPAPGQLPAGGTIYLATADREGNMVSYIQSNYRGFGSGLVVPETGIALQNRGEYFSLNPKDANALKGGKRTFQTIIPGFLSKDQAPIGPFGVMGGAMQPQGHLQVVKNMIDYNLNPQAALDAPRWQWVEDKTVLVEKDFPKHLAESLSRRGHEIKIELNSGSFGRGQIIWRDKETGTYFGGTDGRADGTISAF